MPSFPRNIYHKQIESTRMGEADVEVYKNVLEWPTLLPFTKPTREVSYHVTVIYDGQVRDASLDSLDELEGFVQRVKDSVDELANAEPETVSEQAERIIDRVMS